MPCYLSLDISEDQQSRIYHHLRIAAVRSDSRHACSRADAGEVKALLKAAYFFNARPVCRVFCPRMGHGLLARPRLSVLMA